MRAVPREVVYDVLHYVPCRLRELSTASSTVGLWVGVSSGPRFEVDKRTPFSLSLSQLSQVVPFSASSYVNPTVGKCKHNLQQDL